MENEKAKGGGMEKLAAFIVDKRNLFFLLYIFALIFSVIASGWVKVEDDITTYLPDTTETRQGLTVMNDNFVTYGTANVMVSNITYDTALDLQSQIEDIRQAGFAIDSFGENSFAVRSVPAYLDSGDVQSVISELAEKAMNSRTTVPDRLDDLIHTVACKAAIKAGKPTTMTELQDLCERVLSDDNVRSCPHGRPTTVRLTKYELDKMFKRVNQ